MEAGCGMVRVNLGETFTVAITFGFSDDIYGEEMKLFLRDEDKFGSPQKAIHQFFATIG